MRKMPSIEEYVSDRVFEGKRPLTPERREMLLKKFLEDQEPLGEEFEKVLNDNLWNLYED